MITQPWSLYYQAVAGRYLEAPEAGDQTPPNRADPATWMGRVPYFLSTTTIYTEQPEAGDQTPPNRSEPGLWMWRVPPVLAQDPHGDLFHTAVDTSGDWAFESQPLPMWVLPLFLGRVTEFTEQPEAGDQTPLPRHEPELWMWRVPYFLGEATVYTEQPEAGDQTHEDRTSPQLWMWATPLYLGSATEYTEAPEVGDFVGHPAAEPNLWMWALPYYLGSATEYTEAPETGDQTFENRAEANPWMWTVPYFLGDTHAYTEEPEVGQDGFRFDPGIFAYTIPYFFSPDAPELFHPSVVDTEDGWLVDAPLFRLRVPWAALLDAWSTRDQMEPAPGGLATIILRVAKGLAVDSFSPEAKLVLVGGRRRTGG